jgi:hypothetical protein
MSALLWRSAAFDERELPGTGVIAASMRALGVPCVGRWCRKRDTCFTMRLQLVLFAFLLGVFGFHADAGVCGGGGRRPPVSLVSVDGGAVPVAPGSAAASGSAH